MPKYSIITPSYNSFDLMGRYFESLENQTYKNFEVIIVDDCSTDGSFEKTKAYARRSPLDIKVLQSKKNAGPGNARNIGMDAASGGWITFVDNDDWVDTKILERIDTILSANAANCVIYDYYVQRDGNRAVSKSMYYGKPGICSISHCISAVRNHAVGKFYKLDKLKENGVRYPELRRCEDVAFVCRAIAACGNAFYLDEPLYYYYQRPSSLSNNTKLDETDMIKAFSIIENALAEKYPYEIRAKSVPDLLYGVLLMMCKSEKSNKEIKDYIAKYEGKYPEWDKCEIINHFGRAKKVFLMAAKMKAIYGLKILSKIHTKLVGA